MYKCDETLLKCVSPVFLGGGENLEFRSRSKGFCGSYEKLLPILFRVILYQPQIHAHYAILYLLKLMALRQYLSSMVK